MQAPPLTELPHVLDEFRRHHPRTDVGPIEEAHRVAEEMHRGQRRKSGEPYITHPLAVAHILAGYGLDAETIEAALLHDTVEDTELTLAEVTERFGSTVADLIDGVTKLDRVRFRSKEDQQAATIRKMVIAMAKDVRVLLIKLADRLHNVRTLAALEPEKQQRIAAETIEVYAPLAHRLGVQEIKHEMEDRCFAILHPLRHDEVQDLLARRAPDRGAFIDQVVSEVEKLLAEQLIEAEVTARPKHPYSIYRKMVDAGLTFEEIHDLIGIRVITDSVADCYAALGIVHTHWPPVHGRFKDYIAMPKFNLYQSLHTTVLGPNRKALEVQIRTREMHDRAERGIAAHWAYKEGAGAVPESVAQIAFLPSEYEDPGEFLAGLKLDLYQDEVFVLTPDGDVITLPRGATPVDFAYAIHTEVGHRCTGAKVNRRLVQLDTRLESGDIVEITTSKSSESGPSRDWLSFVRTSRAAAKIRQWYTRERRDAAIAEGRDAVAKLLRKEGLGLGSGDRDRLLDEVAGAMGFRDVEGMYQSIGEHNVQAATAVQRLVRLARPDQNEDDDEVEDLAAPPRVPAPADRHISHGVVVEGLADMWVRLARCCAPVPGDDIVGFVTVGRGVSVHRADCTNIAALGERAERMIEVAWAPSEVGSFRVWLQVEALDRPKLLKDVTSSLSDLGVNIHASSSAIGRDRVAVLRFEVEVSDTDRMDRALAEVRAVDGVFNAYRLTSL